MMVSIFKRESKSFLISYTSQLFFSKMRIASAELCDVSVNTEETTPAQGFICTASARVRLRLVILDDGRRDIKTRGIKCRMYP